jgi:hypothetical protein
MMVVRREAVCGSSSPSLYVFPWFIYLFLLVASKILNIFFSRHIFIKPFLGYFVFGLPLPTYLPYLLISNHGPNIQCMIIFVLVYVVWASGMILFLLELFVCLLLVVYTTTVVGFM